MRILAIAAAAALSTCASTALGGALPRLPPRLWGVPASGREGVPTNVVPAFDAAYLGIGLERTLDGLQFALRTSAGQEIPIDVSLSQGAGYLSIQPARPLEPYTTYLLEAVILQPIARDDPDSLSLSFTTGAGPLDSVPPPISGVVQHWWSPEGASEDHPGEGLCVGFPATAGDELVETRYVKPESGNPDPALTDAFYLDATLEAEPFLTASGDGGRAASNYHDLCVRLRRRAIDGSFSAPTTACSSYAPIYVVDRGYDAQAECGSGFVDAETLSAAGTPEPPLRSGASAAPRWPTDRADSAGCSIERRRSGSRLPVAVLALGAGLVARRARARKAQSGQSWRRSQR